MRYVVVASALLAAVSTGAGSLFADNKVLPISQQRPAVAGDIQVAQTMTSFDVAMERAKDCLKKCQWEAARHYGVVASKALEQNRKLIMDGPYAEMSEAASDVIAQADAGDAKEKKLSAQGLPKPPCEQKKPTDLMELTLDSLKIKHDRAVTLYNLAIESAKKAMDEAEWDLAIRKSEEAVAIVEQNKAFLSGGEFAEFRTGATQNLGVARTKHGVAEETKTAQDEQVAKQQDAIRRQAAAAEKRKLVKSLREQARTMQDSSRFIEAIDLYQRVLQQTPEDQDAKRELRLLQDTVSFRTYDRVRTVQAVETTKTAIQSKETLIPYSDILSYPENWVETTRIRQSN